MKMKWCCTRCGWHLGLSENRRLNSLTPHSWGNGILDNFLTLSVAAGLRCDLAAASQIVGEFGIVRTQDNSVTRPAALIFSLALMLGLGILSLPSKGFARNGIGSGAASSKSLLHSGFAIPAVYVAVYQDAGQAAPPPATPPAAAPAAPKKVELPEGDGKPIATEFCQDCHRLTNLTKAHKAADDWRDTLQLMMDRGARLPPEDVDTLIQYLSANFGPKTDAPTPDAQASSAPQSTPAPGAPSVPAANAAPGAPVLPRMADLPEGDGKTSTIKYCQNCHVLTDIAKERKSSDEWRENLQLTVHRGANIPADQIDILIQYLTKNFGPKSAGPVAGAAASGVSTKSPSQSQ